MFKVTGTVERMVRETYQASVAADSLEEAKDMLYEVLSDPDSPVALERLLCVKTVRYDPEEIVVKEIEEDDAA